MLVYKVYAVRALGRDVGALGLAKHPQGRQNLLRDQRLGVRRRRLGLSRTGWFRFWEVEKGLPRAAPCAARDGRS